MTLITSVLPLGRLRSMVVAATPMTSEPEPEEFSALAIGAAMPVANTTALAMRSRCLGRGEVVIVISVPCQRCGLEFRCSPPRERAARPPRDGRGHPWRRSPRCPDPRSLVTRAIPRDRLPCERARRHAWSMTHDEALAECARLRREHPDRHRRVFAPRKEADGSWGVVIAEPGGLEFASD